MKYQIRHSPEMITKSRIVRTRFCKQLRKNVAKLLRLHLGLIDTASDPHHLGAITVESNWDFIQLELNEIHAGKQSAIEEVHALVTGESIAQVSSQTLVNLAVIDAVTTKLVLRPLCMSDKQEIVDLARQIGTAEFSAVIPEYCGVLSVKPTTRAKLHKIKRAELRFDMTILDRALAAQVKLDISKMQLETPEVATDLEVVSEIPVDALVIDIRHPDKEERRPLQVPLATVKTIPFYKFNNAFALLPVTTQYFLYCEKGVMSQLDASFLADQGYTNIGVYRPEKNSFPVSD